MKYEADWRLNPSDLTDGSAPFQHANHRTCLRFKGKRRAQFLHPLKIKRQRKERKQHIVSRDRKIMHHGGKGSRKDVGAYNNALLVDHVIAHAGTAKGVRHVTKTM